MIRNINHIREQFPVLVEGKNPVIYLDSANSAQKPLDVIKAMDEFTLRSYANVHRGTYDLSQRATIAFEKVREKMAEFLHVSNPQEIVYTRGLTEGVNLLAQSFVKPRLKSGDEILVSEMEHHSNLVPWQILCEEVGGKLTVIPVLENGELDMVTFPKLLTEKVKAIAVTHVSNVLGTINPIREISQIAHAKNIPVIVDGAQAAPHTKVDIQELGCDFYGITGHKLYGPTGTGALYGKMELWKQMKPYHGGGEMVDQVSFEKTTFKDPPARFEAGTPNIIGTVGLGFAIDFIQSIGMDQIEKHEHELLSYALPKLQAIQGIRILGNAKKRIGVIAFVVDGFHPLDISSILDQEGIAVRVGHHCAQPLHKRFGIQGSIRICFGMYNQKSDVDRLIVGIEKAKSLLG